MLWPMPAIPVLQQLNQEVQGLDPVSKDTHTPLSLCSVVTQFPSSPPKPSSSVQQQHSHSVPQFPEVTLDPKMPLPVSETRCSVARTSQLPCTSPGSVTSVLCQPAGQKPHAALTSLSFTKDISKNPGNCSQHGLLNSTTCKLCHISLHKSPLHSSHLYPIPCPLPSRPRVPWGLPSCKDQAALSETCCDTLLFLELSPRFLSASPHPFLCFFKSVPSRTPSHRGLISFA